MSPSLAHSFGFAWQGLVYAFKSDRNLRIHSLAAVLVLSWGIHLRLGAFSMLWLLLACTLVVTAELFNTALEAVVDLASPEHHRLAKVAKDVAAAAVLVVSLFAVAVGVVVIVRG